MTDLRTQATAILDQASADKENWTPTRQAVLDVFRAYPLRAFSTKQIMEIANIVEGLRLNPELVQEKITRLAREKVLRSRMIQGVRHYEIAF